MKMVKKYKQLFVNDFIKRLESILTKIPAPTNSSQTEYSSSVYDKKVCYPVVVAVCQKIETTYEWFKIKIGVVNDTGSTSLVLFDRDVVNLIEKTALKILHDNEEKGLGDSTFNLENNYIVYTVVKLSSDQDLINKIEQKNCSSKEVPMELSCNLHLLSSSRFSGRDTNLCYGNSSSSKFSTELVCRYGGYTSALASQNQTKKSRKRGSFQKKEKKSISIPDKNDGVDSVDVEDGNKTSVLVPTRSAVLQACTLTCGLIGALGFLIRQVSHIAAREGLPVADCSADITFGLESWHLGLITGSVILVSSSRFLLLKIWPDFAQSCEAANQQVLTSLEPLDYLIVAFLPGISEELLFRGSLLPLFGVNWTSILAVAALFGVLHLGSGRNYSFAIWATFVGVVYGYTTVLSSSISVPMATHALNNLVGGIIWRYSSKQTQ